MAQKTLNELDAITTPADASELWIRDGVASPKDRRWSLTNVLAWVRAKFAATPVTILEGGTGDATASGARTNLGLGTAAVADSDDFLTVAGYPSDTAWTTVSSFSNSWSATAGNVRYIKRAGMVTVVGRLNGSSATADTAFTLPVGYRPSVLVWMATGAASGSTVALVNATGAVELTNRTADVRFSVTYPVIT